jgi:hypothetical protein
MLAHPVLLWESLQKLAEGLELINRFKPIRVIVLQFVIFSALFPEKFFLDSEFCCFDHKFSRLTINFPENII